MAAVRIYKAPEGYYVGVNPLKLSQLPPGTTFTLIRPPEAGSHFEQERHWRRQRWRVITEPTPEPHPAFVLDEEIALTPDEAAYFEGLE